MQHHNLHSVKCSGLPVVLFDSDGILTDLNAKWIPRYNADYNDNLTLEQITDWATHRFTKPECGYKYYDYLLEPGFFRDLPPVSGAQEGLEYLSRFIEPVVVTTVPGCAVADRLANLTELFPCLSPDNIIITSRKDLVAPNTVLVEDAPKNVTHSRPYYIIMDYPYNQWCPTGAQRGAFRVRDWGELVGAIRYILRGQALGMTVPALSSMGASA